MADAYPTHAYPDPPRPPSLRPTPPPPVRINAHAPLWRIVDALAASGWGALRDAPQSVRSYLTSLARIADQRSGVAEVTDAQAAERAGISTRSVMRARHWLQDRGVVVQVRRGSRRGLRGVASLLSVAKAALVALLPGARAAKDARAAERAARPGGAARLPNVTARHPFPSLRRKTAAPSRARRGVVPERLQRRVQDELRAFAAAAVKNPPSAATIAAVRASIGRR